MNSPLWIVIANQSTARVFRHMGEGRVPALEFSMEHPEGRARVSELVSDRPGRSFGSAGTAVRHALAPANDAHENEAEGFAREIADRLASERRRERFGALALVCEPKFLGRLRGSLDRETAKCVVATRAAGLTGATDQELVRALEGLVTPAQEILLA